MYNQIIEKQKQQQQDSLNREKRVILYDFQLKNIQKTGLFTKTTAPKAQIILAIIFSFTRKDGEFRGGLGYLAKELLMSRQTLSVYVSKLVKSGLVRKVKRGNRTFFIDQEKVPNNNIDNITLNDITELNMSEKELMERNLQREMELEEKKKFFNYNGIERFKRIGIEGYGAIFKHEMNIYNDGGLPLAKPELFKIMQIAFYAIKNQWVTRLKNNDQRMINYSNTFRDKEGGVEKEIQKLYVELVKNACHEVHVFYKGKEEEDSSYYDKKPRIDRVCSYFDVNKIFDNILAGISYYADKNTVHQNNTVPVQEKVMRGNIAQIVKPQQELKEEIQTQRTGIVSTDTVSETIQKAKERAKNYKIQTQECPPSKRFKESENKNKELREEVLRKLNQKEESVLPREKKANEPVMIGDFLKNRN